MHRLDRLYAEIRNINRQRFTPLSMWRIWRAYHPLAAFMRRRFGWRSWYTFWFSKLFCEDEGGEVDLSRWFFNRFPLALSSPRKVEVEHTTVCNKKCIFCSHTYWMHRQEQMSFDRFRHLLDSMPKLRWLNMAGIGSNYLNRDFGRMLAYARQKHLSVNFVDEFDFFTEDHCREIIALGVNSIYVSFDAARRETYEAIKKGCDYGRALANIRTLLRLKAEVRSPLPVVHFRYLLNTMNVQEMPDFVDLVAGLPNRGARARLEFIGMITFPEVEQYYIPLDQIPEEIVARTYERAIHHRLHLYFSHARAELPPAHRCVRWGEPFILVDGEVIPDCALLMQCRRELLHEFSFGNVFTTPFQEIWDSDRYRRFRRTVVKRDAPIPRACTHCCSFETATRAESRGILE